MRVCLHPSLTHCHSVRGGALRCIVFFGSYVARLLKHGSVNGNASTASAIRGDSVFEMVGTKSIKAKREGRAFKLVSASGKVKLF